MSDVDKTSKEWLSYHHLVGKPVVDADGKRVGRVVDLRAEACGEAFCVTALLVGPTSMLRRLGIWWSGLLGAEECGVVPWEAVARIEDEVHLRVPRSELELPYR